MQVIALLTCMFLLVSWNMGPWLPSVLNFTCQQHRSDQAEARLWMVYVPVAKAKWGLSVDT